MKYKLLFASILATTANFAEYKSQIEQDRYLNETFFHNKKNGVFIDIGAYDGKDHSNTYFFEKDLEWSGICFEPLPHAFAQLKQNRNCICVNACVAPQDGIVNFFEVLGAPDMLSGIVNTYDPRHLERLKHEVATRGGSYSIKQIPSVNFNKVLAEHGISYVDYLSMDTEGSEMEILRSIDFDTVYIYAITVENNYRDPEMRQLLESKGFTYIGYIANQDDVYINSKEHPLRPKQI